MKIVINKKYGGFGLSPEATLLYLKKKGKECFFYKHIYATGKVIYVKITLEEAKSNSLFVSAFTKDMGDIADYDGEFVFSEYSLNRTEKELIEAIEELGSEKASDKFADLKIIEIPDGVDYEISEYDGMETIHEKHRTWS